MKDLDLIVTTGLLQIMEEAGDIPGEQTASVVIHKMLDSAKNCMKLEQEAEWNEYLVNLYNKFKFEVQVH